MGLLLANVKMTIRRDLQPEGRQPLFHFPPKSLRVFPIPLSMTPASSPLSMSRSSPPIVDSVTEKPP
jgi:hypothetical protein